MTPSWRTLEREIIEILRANHLDVVHNEGETYMCVDFDLSMRFSLTTFAKDLAKRLEETS